MKMPLKESGSALWAVYAMVAAVLAVAMVGLLPPFDSKRDGYIARSVGGGERRVIEPVGGVP